MTATDYVERAAGIMIGHDLIRGKLNNALKGGRITFDRHFSSLVDLNTSTMNALQLLAQEKGMGEQSKPISITGNVIQGVSLRTDEDGRRYLSLEITFNRDQPAGAFYDALHSSSPKVQLTIVEGK